MANDKKRYELKTHRENPYLLQYSLADIKLIDDSKYVMRGSSKQFIHMATVMFRGEHFIMFSEHDKVVEWGNRQRLGEENYEFLKDSGYLKPKVYIERVKYIPKAHDTIGTYLEFIHDENLFYFLLEYFKSVGLLKDLEIKATKR